MEPFLGQIQIFGFGFAPRGWAFCDGQLLPISSNTALFSLLGTTFGGDGRTTFALPDLRSRVPVHVGQGPGLTRYVWGQKGGVETVTLTVQQMPSHNHQPVCSSDDASAGSPEGNLPAAVGTPIYSTAGSASMVATQNTGGNQQHTNIQPFLSVYYCIALQGLYPSRS